MNMYVFRSNALIILKLPRYVVLNLIQDLDLVVATKSALCKKKQDPESSSGRHWGLILPEADKCAIALDL